MGRKVSDDLFTLIHALSPSEKRHFRIFSRRHIRDKTNNYVRIFDTIRRMKVYDEQELISAHDFITPRLLPDQKNHVYGQVLHSLLVFSAGKAAASGIQFQVSAFDLVFSKGLYHQCAKMIVRAKKMATEKEKWTDLLSCLEREKKLELQLFNPKTSPARLGKINGDISALLDTIRIAEQYAVLSEEMFLIINQEMAVRSKKNRERSKKILHHPLMRKYPSGGPVHNRFNYLRAHSLYCYSHSDLKGFYKHCNSIVRLMDEHRKILVESPKSYVVALQNLLISQKNLKRYPELFRTLHKLKTYETGSESLRAHIFAVSHDIELTIYIDTGAFEKGAMLGETILRGLDRFRSYLTPRYELLFFFNVAYNKFGCGKYRSAAEWLQKVINYRGAQAVMPDIFRMSNILALLTHYELGNDHLVQYRVKTMRRSYRRQSDRFQLEEMILDFMTRVLGKRGKEKRKLFEEFTRELQRMHKDPEARKSFASFDFIAWAMSRAEGRSMAAVVQERSRLIH